MVYVLTSLNSIGISEISVRHVEFDAPSKEWKNVKSVCNDTD